MQVVKSKNIKISRPFYYLVLLFCLPMIALSQYSKVNLTTDSIKRSVIINSMINYSTIQVKGLKIDRKTMPIFCKWELDIQDQTKIPVKFRLGSQEYVDQLEQKNKHY